MGTNIGRVIRVNVDLCGSLNLSVNDCLLSPLNINVELLPLSLPFFGHGYLKESHLYDRSTLPLYLPLDDVLVVDLRPDGLVVIDARTMTPDWSWIWLWVTLRMRYTMIVC